MCCTVIFIITCRAFNVQKKTLCNGLKSEMVTFSGIAVPASIFSKIFFIPATFDSLSSVSPEPLPVLSLSLTEFFLLRPGASWPSRLLSFAKYLTVDRAYRLQLTCLAVDTPWAVQLRSNDSIDYRFLRWRTSLSRKLAFSRMRYNYHLRVEYMIPKL